MALINDLRKQYKGSAYDQMTDLEIVDYISKTTKRAPDAVAYDLGVSMPDAPGFGTAAQNMLYGAAQGVGQLAGDFIPQVENNNALERFGRAGTQRNPIDIMSGESDSAFANLGSNLMERPLNTIGQIAGSALGLAGGGLAVRGGLLGLNAIRGGTALGTLGRAGLVTGETAAMSAPTYASMRDTQEEQGMNSWEDKLKALGSAAAIGSVERMFGLESALAGRAVGGNSLGGAILRQGLGEAGEEVVQAPIEQFGSGRDVFTMDTLDQAAAGGLAGFVGGGVYGGVGRATGNLFKGGDAQVDLLSENTQPAAEDIRALPERSSLPMYTFPDGSVGTREELEGYITTLPEEQRVAERARILGFGPQQADPAPELPQEINLITEPTTSLQDRINQNLGLSRTPDVSRRADATAAANEPSGVWVNDPNTFIERELTNLELNEMRTGGILNGQTQQQTMQPQGQVQGQQAQVAQQPAPATQPNPLAVVSPDGATVTPAEFGIKSAKKLEAYKKVVDAFNVGDISFDEFMVFGNDIAQTNKIGRVVASIDKRLGEIKEFSAQQANAAVIPTGEAARPVVEQIQQALQTIVTPAQATWWAARSNPDNEGKSDAALAQELGFSRQNASKLAKTSRDSIVTKLSKEFNLPKETIDATIVDYLKATRPRAQAAETVTGMSPEQQQSVIENSDLFGEADGSAVQGMGVIGSVGGSQSDLGGPQVQLTEEELNRPDPVREARIKEAEMKRQLWIDAVLQSPIAGEAAMDWDDMKDASAPTAAELSREDAFDWVYAYKEWKDGEISEQELEEEQRSIEYRVLRGTAGSVQSGGRSDLPQLSNVREADGNTPQDQENTAATRDAGQGRSSGNGQGRTDGERAGRGAEGNGGQQGDGGRGLTQPAPKVETRRPMANLRQMMQENQQEQGQDLQTLVRDLRSMLGDKKHSAIAKDYLARAQAGEDVEAEARKWVETVKADDAARRSTTQAAGNSTVESITNTLRRYFVSTDKFNRTVKVVQNIADLPAAVLKRAGLESNDTGTQAFVLSDGTVYMVASNIRKGREIAVFLHEMGVHVGMEKLLGVENMNRLALQIKTWATKNDGSVESRIAKAALARVKSAERVGGLDKTNTADIVQERIAYFVEEAVKNGIDPIAMQNIKAVGLRQWFSNFMNAVRTALRAIGFRNMDNLTAQNIVNLAYGAANIELLREEASTTDAQVRFSKASDIVNNMSPVVYDAWTNIKDKLSKVAPKLLTTYQLVEQYGGKGAGKLQSLTSYSELSDRMSKTQQQLVNRSHDILTRWGEFASSNKAADEALRKLMLDATMRGIHPDEAFKQGGNSHLSEGQRALHAQLQSRYNALSPEAKRIYQDAKSMLADNWTLRKESYANLVRETYAPVLAKTTDQKEIDRINKIMAEKIKAHEDAVNELKGPYFPLMRFGDLVVVAESKELSDRREALDRATGEDAKQLANEIAKMERNPKHYVVEAFESASEMEKRKAELTQQFGRAPRVSRAENYVNELRPASFGQLELLNDMLETTVGKEESKKLQTEMRTAYLSSLPEHSALQRQIRRKNVSGGSVDMMRAFAEAVERDSFYLSRMQYMDKIASAMNDMRKESRGDVKLGDVYNNVRDRIGMDFAYNRSPIAAALTRMSSIWHLGVAPSYLLANMTQPFMITVPQLAGRYGAGNTSRAVSGAWSDATKIITAGRDGKFFSLKDADLTKNLKPGEANLVRNLMDLGKLDIANNMDTEVYASGTNPKMIKFYKWFNFASHNIELVNRLTTALAAYRLEVKKSGDVGLATQKAREAIELTQLDYSDTNAAYFMKAGHLGGWNRVPMQFRKYQQGMIYLLARNIKQAAAGDKDAMKAFTYLMATQLVMTGVRGVPVIAPLMFVLGLGMDDDDEDGDLETRLRNYTADMVGDDAARVFWKGLPSLMGVDAQNISMETLLKPLPMLRADDVLEASTGQEAVETLMVNAAGAPVGLISRFANSAVYMRDGDYQKGIEQLLPKFLAAPAKAARIATEGVTTRNGNVAVEAEEIDLWDAAIKAAGFSPIIESEYYEALSAKEAISSAIQDRRNAILSEYAIARRSGESVSDVMQMVKEFNSDHPSNTITYDTLTRSLNQRKKDREERDAVGIRFRKNESSYKDVTRFAVD